MGMALTTFFLLWGVYEESGLPSDIAEFCAVVSALGLVTWATHWAKCSKLISRLVLLSFFSLLLTEILDLSENFEALDDYPILGANSSLNGTLETVGLSFGFIFVFAALLFAVIEAQAGRVADRQYRLLADNVSDVISTSDLSLMGTYVSPSVYRMRGFTPEEALAQRPEEYFTPASLEKAVSLLQSELERLERGDSMPDEGVSVELDLYHKDGSIVPVETRVSALVGDDGQVSGILAVSRDISERKRTEESLRQSEARYRTLVENAPVCIHEIDLEGRICSMNSTGLQMMGCAREDEVRNLPYLNTVSDKDRDRVRQALERANKGERVSFQFESHAGAKTLCLTSELVPLKNDNGHVVRLMGITNDITEQIAAQQARARLEAQLNQAQKMESVGRLAGGVAHDFNNMLGVILGHAEMALEHGKAAPETRENLEEIRKFCNRAADLTRQLLGFARKQTVEPQVLHLNVAMENTINMLRRLIGERVQLEFAPGADLWPVHMDPSQVDQILANLCVNARDAIDSAGQLNIATMNVVLADESNVDIPGILPGEYVQLTVQDNGEGMDSETIEQVFEPFFTTKERGKGTGLGLATVYGIVKQNKGFIGIESVPGAGTTVTIYLPRYVGAETAEPIPTQIDTLSRGNETILLVEDEPALLCAAQAMLTRVGYTVLASEDPVEAIAIYDQQDGAIDLLVTDVIMPGMNGYELVKALESRTPGLKWLYMSGYAADVFGSDGLLDEGINFVQKPFTFKQLTTKVRLALDCNGRSTIA